MTLSWDIPPNWGTRLLKDIAPENASQITPANHHDTVFNYWGLDAITRNQFTEPSPNPIPGSNIQSTCVQFDEQHVLYCKLRPYLNKVIVPSVPGIGSTEWVPLKPDPNALDRKYLAFVLRSPQFVKYISSNVAGARMPRAKKSVLRRTPIPIPYPDDPGRSLAEQRRIVARLEALLGEVREMRELAQAMEQDIGRVMDVVYEEAYPGKHDHLPHGWEMLRFPDVCEINPRRPRIQRNPDTVTSFVPMASVDALTGDITVMEMVPYQQVRSGYRYFEEGDVLFAKITPSMQNGKAAIARNLIDGFGFGSTEFHVLRPRNGILPEWIYHYIRRTKFRNEAKKRFRGAAGQQRVPQEFLETHVIPVPYPNDSEKSLMVQKQIVARFEAAKNEIIAMLNSVNEDKHKLGVLEQSILAAAFRGEL